MSGAPADGKRGSDRAAGRDRSNRHRTSARDLRGHVPAASPGHEL